MVQTIVYQAKLFFKVAQNGYEIFKTVQPELQKYIPKNI